MMRSRLSDAAFRTLRAVNALMSGTLSMRVMRDANLYPWQRNPLSASVQGRRELPVGSNAYLQRDNPRLIDLIERYRRADPRVTSSVFWTADTVGDTDLTYFRGHNSYTDQLSGLHANELTYALTYYALKSSSAADLLAMFEEDGAFGVNSFVIDERPVSRDILDSAREVEFIRTNVGWDAQPLTMVDIGAGYGRLVHRLAQAGGSRVTATGTDGYAPSTFIAEHYLNFRSLSNTGVVALDEFESWLAEHRPRLATNIHSFSEVAPTAIDWWVERLARHRVEYLMIVPNLSDPATGAALTNGRDDIDEIVARHGYRLVVREPHHADPTVLKYAVDSSVLSLFRLADAG